MTDLTDLPVRPSYWPPFLKRVQCVGGYDFNQCQGPKDLKGGCRIGEVVILTGPCLKCGAKRKMVANPRANDGPEILE